MKFSWNSQTRPILLLAPMAGYTDSAYRQLVKSLAPRTIVVSEFVSSDAIKYKSKKTFKMLKFDSVEQPLIVQIFGKKPEHFAESAKVLEALGVAGVDINMGCPARKVVSSDHGSALLKNHKLAQKIIEATVAAVKIPVSVKMRLGIDTADGLIDFTKMVEGAGASLITIHGRTVKQKYRDVADYEPIYKVKEALSIPVVGNGDIDSVRSFQEKLGNLPTGQIGLLDGLMIGRGTVGNPWLMAELAATITKQKYQKPQTLKEKLPVILKHCELNIATKGEEKGMLEMRKYLAGYVKGEPGAREVRAKLVRVETLGEAKELLTKFSTRLPCS